MTLYHLSVALHVLAASLWLGHMFFWSLFSGPALKKIQPPEVAERLRAVMRWRGGLGWPALGVLAVTGLYQMRFRGVTPGMLVDGTMLQSAAGRLLACKLLLVLGMVGYQAIWAHRPAPRAIYFNMLAALLVLAASVLLVRG
jgi:uncharacterized membrane protein